METFSVVIIGAGPAGLAAAMQLTRQGHQPLVLERNQIGGLLWNANLVENYPGFPEGIPGPELVARFEEQAKRLAVNIAFEEAQVTGFEDDLFRIATKQRKLAARFLVAASGTKAIKLPEEWISPAFADRVFSEVYPLLNCRHKKLVIIGGGDAAYDYALNLARENQVMILTRGEETRALPLLVERAHKNPDILCQSGAELVSVAESEDGRLQLEVISQGDQISLVSDYLIGAIGREPDTSFAAPSIIKKINELRNEGRLHLIGDLENGLFRQTAIAVGDGLRTAMKIDQSLSKESL